VALDDSEQSVREAHTELHSKFYPWVIEERGNDDVEGFGMALHQFVKLLAKRVVDRLGSRT
jgi:hypothetical protein